MCLNGLQILQITYIANKLIQLRVKRILTKKVNCRMRLNGLQISQIIYHNEANSKLFLLGRIQPCILRLFIKLSYQLIQIS